MMMPGGMGQPAPRGGGGQMTPGGGGGGGGMGGFQSPVIPGVSALQRGQQDLQGMQQAIMQAEQRCARGDGYNCQLAQRLRQQMMQANQAQQQQIGLQGMRGQGGTAGIGRGGGGAGATRMPSYASTMLQSMYGGGGGW